MSKVIRKIKFLFSKMDKVLLFTTIFLFLFGLLNIVTASSREAVVRYSVSTYHYFFKQLEMLIGASFLSLFIINISTKKYKNLIIFGYVFILLLVLLVFPFGAEVNGAQTWLKVPGIGTFQPSELAKPVIIVYSAVLFEKYQRILSAKNNPLKNSKIGVILTMAGIIPLLTFFQHDLGSAMIITLIFGVLFLTSPIDKKSKINVIGILVILLILAIGAITFSHGKLLTKAQLSRFDFFNPCSKYETTGYQICNGFIAINEGGLFGQGIGKSKQKYSYIPEPHTDSIFSIIAEEYGFIKCSFIFLAYIIVLFRILKTSTNCHNLRGRYICLGIATYIFIHIFLNLGGLFGIIPLTGVPLPFLSYGGTYAISLMCSLAVVQRINIENKLEKIKLDR